MAPEKWLSLVNILRKTQICSGHSSWLCTTNCGRTDKEVEAVPATGYNAGGQKAVPAMG